MRRIIFPIIAACLFACQKPPRLVYDEAKIDKEIKQHCDVYWSAPTVDTVGLAEASNIRAGCAFGFTQGYIFAVQERVMGGNPNMYCSNGRCWEMKSAEVPSPEPK